MEPTPGEIRLQLGRILASDAFANADRLSRFLRYVVEQTLGGEGDRLKEYVIGTEVFDRDEQYDPRLDSIVRVEAGRLRAKVEEYYNHHGVDDAVIIRLRRGSYAPVFERRPTSSVPLTTARSSFSKLRVAAIAVTLLALMGIAAWRADLFAPDEPGRRDITIAVLPFANYSTDESARLLAARVTDGVTTELARIGTLGVVSHTSALQFAGVRKPLRELAEALSADVVMEASLLADGEHLKVDVRLVDAALDRKFWVEDFVGSVTDVRDLQHRIAAAAAVAAARHRSNGHPRR